MTVFPKDTVKNIKNTVKTIKNTVKPSIPLGSSSNTPKRTQHNMPDDGILQNAWRYFSWTRKKKTQHSVVWKKYGQIWKKTKNAVTKKMLSFLKYCHDGIFCIIFFIEISYAKTKMLSKNVVIDGIMEYVDGIIILSGVSGQTSGRTSGQTSRVSSVSRKST